MKQSKINSALLILRLSLGIMMLLYGFFKLFNGVNEVGLMLTEKGLPYFISYGVIVGEVIAPLMIIIGYRTKIAAILLAFTMVVAILLAHSNDIFSLNSHGGWAIDHQGLFLFGSIALILSGAGKYAVSTKSKWD
jgi:putative oxidoreductase